MRRRRWASTDPYGSFEKSPGAEDDECGAFRGKRHRHLLPDLHETISYGALPKKKKGNDRPSSGDAIGQSPGSFPIDRMKKKGAGPVGVLPLFILEDLRYPFCLSWGDCYIHLKTGAALEFKGPVFVIFDPVGIWPTLEHDFGAESIRGILE